jgi:predicted flavoprotein YhiN
MIATEKTPECSKEISEIISAAFKLVVDLDELMANSDGVAGLHMNGEVADWDSLCEGGSFDAWLSSLEQLRRALLAGDR